jgi:exodeoxyribonuclease-3
MKIVSWNVAGLRAMIKKGNLLEMLNELDPDVVCLQETKAEEHQVLLPEVIANKYPYRIWQSTRGTTQRKGLSGTTIWSKEKPERQYNPPQTDEEGRITTVEFDKYIIVCVYTPNSQGPDTPRLEFRTTVWHENFKEYIAALKILKPTIICGDLNVAHEEIDIHNPKNHKNCAGFLDIERKQFQEYLDVGYTDAFRYLNPDVPKQYTYWNILNPKIRENNSGWRIDYFLVSEDVNFKNCTLLTNVYGSDHCPVYLEVN